VTHFSIYRYLIDDPTGQTIKWHVINHMSKFELNPTVNELGKSILLKLRILEKLKNIPKTPNLFSYFTKH